jgi:quercetin dioxygenase-like cupin family protein
MLRPTTTLSCVALALFAAFVAGYAVGQATPPAENKGVNEVLLRSLDLTDEMQATNGRSLRMRRMTLAPGGVLGLHSHKDRPAVSYFLEGEVTYHPTGRPDVVVGPGEGIAEGKATTHWAENRGKVPAVWIAVDIPK